MLQQAQQWKTNVAQAQGNLIFGQPFETRLRFPDGCRIANIDSLDDDGYRVPDGAAPAMLAAPLWMLEIFEHSFNHTQYHGLPARACVARTGWKPVLR